MKHIQEIESALSSFKIASASQATATEKGDYKKGNKAFNQIVRIINYLESIDRLNELETLLYDPNVGVRLFAAWGLLKINPKHAIPILREIAQQDDIHSLTASTTLEQWYQNKLKLP